jgi:hypothetical protein
MSLQGVAILGPKGNGEHVQLPESGMGQGGKAAFTSAKWLQSNARALCSSPNAEEISSP